MHAFIVFICMGGRWWGAHRVDVALGELVAQAKHGPEGGGQDHAADRGCVRGWEWIQRVSESCKHVCGVEGRSMHPRESVGHVLDLSTLSKTFLVPSTAGFTSSFSGSTTSSRATGEAECTTTVAPVLGWLDELN